MDILPDNIKKRCLSYCSLLAYALCGKSDYSRWATFKCSLRGKVFKARVILVKGYQYCSHGSVWPGVAGDGQHLLCGQPQLESVQSVGDA